jgi:hypothetical protein
MSGEFSITLSVPMPIVHPSFNILATFGIPTPSIPFDLGHTITPVPFFATIEISSSSALVI